MDHCYARPAPVKPARPPAAAAAGGGGFDHDYTKPRTPPRAAAPPALPPVPKERTAVTKKKAALPAQPVKFKQREVTEKFKILYKFLTDGIDLEDIMYLKRSYEMVTT